MFGLNLKVILLGITLAATGVGYGAFKNAQVQRALRDLDAAQARLQAVRGELQNCSTRLLDIQEDAASDLEIDQIPDDDLGNAVLPHWMRGESGTVAAPN